MKRNRKTITIQDVAKAAGVSVSTVSRVLNEKDDVASETYEKVRQVIDDLRYASSLAARGMRSHRTNLIGLVLPDVASPYCIEIMQGVNQVIAPSTYDLIIYTQGDFQKYNSGLDSHFVMLLNGTITDGVVVVAAKSTDFSSHAPLVIIDPNNEIPNFPAVISTNRDGTAAAMQYLIGLGHRRIGHITGRLELLSARQRLQSYQDTLAQAGIPYDDTLVRVGDYSLETARDCARELLSMENRPTAIFAANDMSAMGVYGAAEEMRLRIPHDLSVVGFDNLRDAAYLQPALTTVDQSIPQMGAIATEMVVRLTQGERLETNLHTIQTKLLVRESCCHPSL